MLGLGKECREGRGWTREKGMRAGTEWDARSRRERQSDWKKRGRRKGKGRVGVERDMRGQRNRDRMCDCGEKERSGLLGKRNLT